MRRQFVAFVVALVAVGLNSTWMLKVYSKAEQPAKALMSPVTILLNPPLPLICMIHELAVEDRYPDLSLLRLRDSDFRTVTSLFVIGPSIIGGFFWGTITYLVLGVLARKREQKPGGSESTRS